MLTFQFALDENDCAAYFEATMLENLSARKNKSGNYIFIVYAIVLLVLFYSDYSSGQFPVSFLISLVIFGFLAFLRMPRKNKLSPLYKKANSTQVKNFVANPDNEAFFETKKYHVGDVGMEVISSTGESKLFWRAFVKRKDTDTHIFLFNGQVSALVFPKNKIASLAEFEAMLARHISFHAEVGRQIK